MSLMLAHLVYLYSVCARIRVVVVWTGCPCQKDIQLLRAKNRSAAMDVHVHVHVHVNFNGVSAAYISTQMQAQYNKTGI